MPSAAAQGDISSPWLHGAMSKQDAERKCVCSLPHTSLHLALAVGFHLLFM